MNVSRYAAPQRWIRYDRAAIADHWETAKAASVSLRALAYPPQTLSQMLERQLKMEAAATARIEGAEFDCREQAIALAADAIHAKLNHSQRQLRAAYAAGRWLYAQPIGRPVSADFILGIHRRVVAGCDDRHCEPGAYRKFGQNVTFGAPQCRGVQGGDDCGAALQALCDAADTELRAHDPIIRALATHYHLTAMHPFNDGNGRTARAVEAFMLRQAGINAPIPVNLSDYYYAHREDYFASLYASRQRGHDITPFLEFALPAVTAQCNAVAGEIIAGVAGTD